MISSVSPRRSLAQPSQVTAGAVDTRGGTTSSVGPEATHSVGEFCEEAFGLLDLDWKAFVKHDDRYNRPSEVDLLWGDPSKAKRVLGWTPKVTFKDLVRMMVEADLRVARQELAVQQAGGVLENAE